MAGEADALWGWPDALFAAVLAVGLAVVFSRSAARLGRRSATGPAVAAALVLALSGTVFTHGLPVVRLVLAVVLGAAVLTALPARRRRRTGTMHDPRNEIADPIRR